MSSLVEDWKKLAVLSGTINKHQLDNIKNLPWTILSNQKDHNLKIEVDYDLKLDSEDKTKSYVHYNIVTDDTVDVNLGHALKVSYSLRTLFWDNLEVIFKFNGEEFWSTNE